MKKKKIIYGVNGMMEYQAVIKVGRNYMKVPFTDGSVSAMGVNPATFTTDSFIIQHAIENSSDFKRGRIRVVNTIELEEELHIERNSERPAAGVSGATPAAVAAAPKAEDVTIVEDTKSETAEQTSPTIEPLPEKQKNVATMTQVEFSCNDDAKDYLEQEFGYVRSRLRNREDIIAAGKAHGVEIVFV